MRVLILSPGHPDLEAGGAERAAYSLFERLRADRRIRGVAFAAPRPAEAPDQFALDPDARLVELPGVHAFTFRSQDRDRLEHQIRALMAEFEPDVVHVHDFLHWSIEVPEIVRKSGRRCVLTLHEYALICTHYGQLVTPSGKLCTTATPAACSSCFPAIEESYFRARRHHMLEALRHVDALVTPSAFALHRLRAWGVDPHQGRAIENLVSSATLRTAAVRSRRASGGPVVVGYFGQVTPFKGLDVLVRACADIVGVPGLEVRVHGANTHYRDAPFQAEIERVSRDAAAAGLLRFMGEYDNRDVLRLMHGCHAVAVPSIWWENSPLVIREAKLAGCIVICSDIGGMKEKTASPPDIRFPPGKYKDLAAILRDLAATGSRNIHTDVRGIVRTLREDAAALERHIDVYYRNVAGLNNLT
jgi:glycosyltransferase involved in cell wall biosynthesis